MVQASQVKPNATIVCSKNAMFGKVARMDGATTIKLEADAHGKTHYIPLAWVTRADDQLHLDRPGDQAMKEWSETPPARPAH